jgi:hypothetical protein
MRHKLRVRCALASLLDVGQKRTTMTAWGTDLGVVHLLSSSSSRSRPRLQALKFDKSFWGDVLAYSLLGAHISTWSVLRAGRFLVLRLGMFFACAMTRYLQGDTQACCNLHSCWTWQDYYLFITHSLSTRLVSLKHNTIQIELVNSNNNCSKKRGITLQTIHRIYPGL